MSVAAPATDPASPPLASALYEGWVRHRRLLPVPHAFRYRLLLAYLDLDELPELFPGSRLWSSDARRAPVRFRREDHLGDPQRPLRTCVLELVRERLGRAPEGPVRILTSPAYWGYCFNPVSFYFCFAADGTTLEAVVAEVNNTPWGERHCYVMDESTNEGAERVKRWRFAKAFHVSPFMEMDQHYDWRVSVPGRALTVHFDSWQDGAKRFDATMLLRRCEPTAANLRGALRRFPFTTLKVIVAIHWQALRLLLKRVPFIPHPAR